jgi:hypothetical protein
MNTIKKKGKGRLEAFNELNVEPVELLSTGELKLANGKIIGHRDYKHIYRQKIKLPDEREQVVINKLALEYRLEKHGAIVVTNVPANMTSERVVKDVARA